MFNNQNNIYDLDIKEPSESLKYISIYFSMATPKNITIKLRKYP